MKLNCWRRAKEALWIPEKALNQIHDLMQSDWDTIGLTNRQRHLVAEMQDDTSEDDDDTLPLYLIYTGQVTQIIKAAGVAIKWKHRRQR
jgi:hypothetical protein